MNLPDTRLMNNSTARATARATLSPRYGAAKSPATGHHVSAAMIIPAPELRRLVAAMVD